jgi:TetR/AcrR family transcriptional regulator, transcriptional repressor for nem operon
MSGAAKRLPQSNRAETRSKLVQIGTEILSEKGFDTTTIDEVLQRASVPKGSFYYYFPSKADFGLAVIDNYAFLWEQKLTRLLRDPNVRPLQRVRNYIVEAARGLETHEFRRGCLIGNMGQELGGLDDVFRERILAVLNSWTGFLAECLRQGQDAGEIRADLNVRQIASFFWFSWEGAILKAKLERSTLPLDQFTEVTFKSILTT